MSKKDLHIINYVLIIIIISCFNWYRTGLEYYDYFIDDFTISYILALSLSALNYTQKEYYIAKFIFYIAIIKHINCITIILAYTEYTTLPDYSFVSYYIVYVQIIMYILAIYNFIRLFNNYIAGWIDSLSQRY